MKAKVTALNKAYLVEFKDEAQFVSFMTQHNDKINNIEVLDEEAIPALSKPVEVAKPSVSDGWKTLEKSAVTQKEKGVEKKGMQLGGKYAEFHYEADKTLDASADSKVSTPKTDSPAMKGDAPKAPNAEKAEAPKAEKAPHGEMSKEEHEEFHEEHPEHEDKKEKKEEVNESVEDQTQYPLPADLAKDLISYAKTFAKKINGDPWKLFWDPIINTLHYNWKFPREKWKEYWKEFENSSKKEWGKGAENEMYYMRAPAYADYDDGFNNSKKGIKEAAENVQEISDDKVEIEDMNEKARIWVLQQLSFFYDDNRFPTNEEKEEMAKHLIAVASIGLQIPEDGIRRSLANNNFSLDESKCCSKKLDEDMLNSAELEKDNDIINDDETPSDIIEDDSDIQLTKLSNNFWEYEGNGLSFEISYVEDGDQGYMVDVFKSEGDEDSEPTEETEGPFNSLDEVKDFIKDKVSVSELDSNDEDDVEVDADKVEFDDGDLINEE